MCSPTHTVNNSLQKLNYVKRILYFVVKQNSILFITIPWVLCKIQLIKFERIKIESHNNWNFNVKSAFHLDKFNSCVKTSFCNKICMQFM